MVKAGIVFLIIGAAAAVAAPDSGLFVDLKFAAMVATQLFTVGALWGSLRSKINGICEKVTEIHQNQKNEVFPRLNRIEINLARHEGKSDARFDNHHDGHD